jgi:hypothetical protein
MGIRIVFIGIGLALATGCNERNFTPLPRGDGGVRPATDAGSDPRCPGVPAYTGMACSTEQIGSTCPGQSMCVCGGTDFRTVPTSCTCNDGALGRVYECADACVTACGSDAGVGRDGGSSPGTDAGAPPGVTCAQYCAHLNTVTCTMDFSGCEGACDGLRERGCIPQLEAFLACGLRSPVECDPEYGIPRTVGCTAEDAAWGACIGP